MRIPRGMSVHDEKSHAEGFSATALIVEMGKRARTAAQELATSSSEAKAAALTGAATAIRKSEAAILTANAKDMEAGRDKGLSTAMLDRLALDTARIEGIAVGLETVAALPDPIGTVLSEWDRPNGLNIQRVRVPLGVIGIIYEARPNVTADAGGLCLKAGNAAILRGGSECFHSSAAIITCLHQGLTNAGLPKDAIQAIPTTDRAAVGAMLKADGLIDVIVPRGGASLIQRVMDESRIPIFAHLQGLCHVYLHEAADPAKALAITLNAKLRRTGICGAAETLLADRSAAERLLPPVIEALIAEGCELRGDADIRALDSRILPANEDDWRTEYLDKILSVRLVDGIDEAINHINSYGSHHTDSIITEDSAAAEHFLARIDSGICMLNTSTQFADGGEFGMGAEIGISTGKMHARGPVGAEQLTTYKYLVRGDGHTRPL